MGDAINEPNKAAPWDQLQDRIAELEAERREVGRLIPQLIEQKNRIAELEAERDEAQAELARVHADADYAVSRYREALERAGRHLRASLDATHEGDEHRAFDFVCTALTAIDQGLSGGEQDG
jgi:chromosome segregation ATPase